MAIFGSFRKADADDPEIYLAAYEHILRGYPDEVVREVADPRRGIAGQQTFLPSTAELKAACDKIHDPILRRAETARRNEEFLAKSIANKQEEEERKRQAAERAEWADNIMLANGFIPKAMRDGKLKRPDELTGVAKERRLAEIAAEEAKLAELRKMPLPTLSDAAKAIFEKGGQ